MYIITMISNTIIEVIINGKTGNETNGTYSHTATQQ